MTISLEDFAAGDTTYISKLNTNNSALETAINALQAQLGGAWAAASLPTALRALFGATAARIGSASLTASIDGQTVVLAAGNAWLASLGSVVASAGGAADLTGAADGTYYVTVDAAGTPAYSASSTDALYSVAKSGTTLSSLTAVAGVTWADSEWKLAQSSAVLGTFTSLDARLEAMEAQPYDVAIFFPGAPDDAALLSRLIMTRDVTFPQDLTDSQANARVGATAETTLALKKNGSSIGTCVFALGGTTGVFTFASEVLFEAGDILTVENQATADATLGDISLTLSGTR